MIDTCYVGDVRDGLRAFIAAGHRAQTSVTSPPYWGLRDYGTAQWDGGDPACDHRNDTKHQQQGSTSARAGRANVEDQRNENFRDACGKCGARRVDKQLGLEPTPAAFIANMVEVFRLVRDALADDGTLWLNMGDSYNAAGRDGHGTRIGFKQQTNRASGNGADSNRPTDAALKPKDLVGMPWRLAFALQDDGWYLRSDIIWHKPNPMPESVTDRPTKSHEYLFLLAKSERYFYDAEAIKEPASEDTHARYARGRSDEHKWADGGPGNQTIARSFDHMRKPVAGWASGSADHSAIVHAREQDGRDGKLLRKVYPGNGVGFGHGYDENVKPRVKNNASFDAAMAVMPSTRNKRTVWTIPTEPYSEAHFATFPTALVEPCVLAGSRVGDVVLDPFMGSGTVAQVAQSLGRRWFGTELNPDYVAMQRKRTAQLAMAL